MIVGVTGHRPGKLGKEWNHKGPVTDHLRKYLKEILTDLKATSLISGLALGFDTIAAQTALEMNLELIGSIPFREQHLRWNEEAQKEYLRLRGLCTSLHVAIEGTSLSRGHIARAMQIRNMWTVNNCGILVAAFDGTSGGTANTILYAQKIGKPIARINPSPQQAGLIS
jgi:uncharacterized phage-like protein YoqJ